MEELKLDDLPQYSPWPARLLGLAGWTVATRTLEKVEREYDRDKYAQCLEFYQSSGEHVSPEAIKRFEYGSGLSQGLCVSVGNRLYECSLEEARHRYYEMIYNGILEAAREANCIVELGAGYGFNLWMLRQQGITQLAMGGEFSKNAVVLASQLFQSDPNITVLHFNFLEPRSYELLESLRPPIMVFTAHAIEQLPSCDVVLDSLARYRALIGSIFHFEPIYELHDDSLFGLMRRRYAEVNDYNTDLLSQLKKRSWIRICEVQPHAFGLNPLNPTSVIRWEFAR